MRAEVLQIILNKLSTSYTEQIWAVTLFCSMGGVVILKAKYLIETIGYNILRIGVIANSGLCMAFIAMRFYTYWKYDEFLIAKFQYLGNPPIANPALRNIALFSGTTFYLLIVFALCLVTLRACRKEFEKNKITNKDRS